MAQVKQKQVSDRAIDPKALVTLQKYEDLRKARPDHYPWMVADVAVPFKYRLHPDDYNDGKVLQAMLVQMKNAHYNIKDRSSVLKDRVGNAYAVWTIWASLIAEEARK